MVTAGIQTKINKLDELLDDITSSLADLVMIKRKQSGKVMTFQVSSSEKMNNLLQYMEQEQMLMEHVEQNQNTLFSWLKSEKSWFLISKPGKNDRDITVHAAVARIFIQPLNAFKSFQFSSSLTAFMAVRSLVQKLGLESLEELELSSVSWKLYEMFDDMNMERPILDYEGLLDIVNTWRPSSKNFFALKRMDSNNVQQEAFQSMTIAINQVPLCGWSFVEMKRKRWQHKFIELRPSGDMYCYDSEEKNNPLFLCHILHVNFYSMMKPSRKAPTKFCIGVKNTSHSKLFQEDVDYFKVLALEDQEKLSTWLSYLHAAKLHFYQERHRSKIVSSASLTTQDYKPRTMSCSIIDMNSHSSISLSNTERRDSNVSRSYQRAFSLTSLRSGTAASSSSSQLSQSVHSLYPSLDGRTANLRASMISDGTNRNDSFTSINQSDISIGNLDDIKHASSNSKKKFKRLSNIFGSGAPKLSRESKSIEDEKMIALTCHDESSRESINDSNRASFCQGLTLNMNEHFCT